MIRPLGRPHRRALAAVGGLVLVAVSGGAPAAGAAVPRRVTAAAGRVSTTTVPATTTTVAPTSTQASSVTTLPQASTDTTPSARRAGTVAADPAQKRLRWIIGGLVGLAVIILVATIWFWRATSPKRRVTVTELTPDDGPGPVDTGPTAPEPWPEAIAHQGGPERPETLPLMAPSGPLPTTATGAVPASGPVAARTLPPLAAAPPAHPMAEPTRPPVVIAPPSPSDPDPPSFAEPPPTEPPPTETVPGVPPPTESTVTGRRAVDEDDESDEDDDEAWEPRLPDPPSGDGEWRGIRPLGPAPRE